MALEKVSLSFADVHQILNKDGFGIASFARAINPDNPLDSFSFAVHTGLVDLSNPPICSCGQPKRLSIRQEYANSENQGLQWVCDPVPGAPRCRIRRSVTSGTVFDKAKVPWHKILELILHWYLRSPVTYAAGQVGVSKECAIEYYSRCRDVCFEVITEQDICIGGPGLHVELDETHIRRRKYHRGRVLASESIWVFGGICRETKEAFSCVVENRKGETLWPIIKRKVAPGSIIMTDSARVYDNLHLRSRGGFEHYQVNHKLHFVDPYDRNINTNTIERHWGLGKSGMVRGIVDGEHVEMYLTEFEYRRQFFGISTDREKRHLGIPFKHFLKDLAKMFPGATFDD